MDLQKQIMGIFERRFIMNALMPVTGFWGLLAVVVILDRGAAADALMAWDSQTTLLKTAETLGAAIAVLGTAGLLSAATMNILRFFEGYWPSGMMAIVGRRSIDCHRRRLNALDGSHATNEIYFSYPPATRPNEVMPTRLGNILKASEIYANQRYGLDPVLIWPRLYGLLPESAIATVSSLRALVEFHLAVAVMAVMFGVASGVYLVAVGGSPSAFLLSFWGGMLVGWLAYLSSFSSVIAYAEQVKAVFDIYRNELLLKLRIPLPADPDQELATWREVGEFLLRNLREHPDQWSFTDYRPPGLSNV